MNLKKEWNLFTTRNDGGHVVEVIRSTQNVRTRCEKHTPRVEIIQDGDQKWLRIQRNISSAMLFSS